MSVGLVVVSWKTNPKAAKLTTEWIFFQQTLSRLFRLLEDSDLHIGSQMNGSGSMTRSNRQFIQLNRNWIKKPCRCRQCQILLPGHFLWGNSQHVGCKDHSYTAHSQDRPLILDDFSQTQIMGCDNIFESPLPGVFRSLFLSYLLTTRAAWWRFLQILRQLGSVGQLF